MSLDGSQIFFLREDGWITKLCTQAMWGELEGGARVGSCTPRRQNSGRPSVQRKEREGAGWTPTNDGAKGGDQRSKRWYNDNGAVGFLNPPGPGLGDGCCRCLPFPCSLPTQVRPWGPHPAEPVAPRRGWTPTFCFVPPSFLLPSLGLSLHRH